METNIRITDEARLVLLITNIGYGGLTPILVKAIQEIYAENLKLKVELYSKDKTYSWC